MSTRQWVLAHELGHVVGNIHHNTDVGTVWSQVDKSKPLHHGGLSKYGTNSMYEAYAEAFAHRFHGGEQQSTADYYQKMFGWEFNRKKAPVT